MPSPIDFFPDAMRRDPYPTYAQLRARSPVMHVPGADLWLLLDHDSVKRALHDHEAFTSSVGASRQLRFEWLLFMDPPRHTQLRGMITRAFTPRTIANLEPRIRALSAALLAPLIARGEFDLVRDFAT